MKKLSWKEIEEQYHREWIQIVDYDWVDTEVYPRRGVVRTHAKSREEFDNLVMQQPLVDSAVIFVGAPESPPEGVVPSANLGRHPC